MAEYEVEKRAAQRLSRNLDRVVKQLRELADGVERDGARNLERAISSNEDYTYGNVAAQVFHTVSWALANLNLGNLVDAATDADRGRFEKGNVR